MTLPDEKATVQELEFPTKFASFVAGIYTLELPRETGSGKATEYVLETSMGGWVLVRKAEKKGNGASPKAR